MAQSGTAANAKADSTGAGIGLYLVVGFAVIGGFYFSKLPPGTVPRALNQHLDSLLLMAAFPLLVAFPFAAGDRARAVTRTYRPPSLRVQVSRSLVYGLALGAANVLVLLWWKHFLIQRLAGLGLNGFYVGLLAIPYALGVWGICFRRRTFIVQPLPSFRAACETLRETNDFVLGRTGAEWKTGEGDPRWLVLPENSAYGNWYCLGGIGSGKTQTVIKPLLEQALYKFPSDPSRKIAIALWDAKGNNKEYVLERARKFGREEDVVVITPGGKWTYNPLSEGNPTALANKLVAALEAMTNQESNSYYKKMQREFAQNAFSILADVLGQGMFTMMDVYDFICDSKVQSEFLSRSNKNSTAYRWFKNQWEKEDPREQMMLTKGFRADLSSFVSDEMAPTFCVRNPSFPGWTSLADSGTVLVFSMSLDQYGEFARAMGIFVLMDFQNAMLARTTPEFVAAGHNRERLILCVLDEVWAYMNEKLADFTSVSREARCCTLAAHQGLAQIPEKYRPTIIGNFRTPIILGINDQLSLQTFSELFGTHKVRRESRSESTGFSGVERQLLTDRLNAKAGGESRSISVSVSDMDEPRFSKDEILHLKKFSAAVQVFDGDNTLLPTVVNLCPTFLEENQLA